MISPQTSPSYLKDGSEARAAFRLATYAAWCLSWWKPTVSASIHGSRALCPYSRGVSAYCIVFAFFRLDEASAARNAGKAATPAKIRNISLLFTKIKTQ